MCSGHGIHRLIGMAAAALSAPERRAHSTSQAGNNSADIEDEVKLMYARGEIGAQAFRRLHALAQANRLQMQDIQTFRDLRADKPAEGTLPEAQADGSTLAYKHHLQKQREYLEAACVETSEALRRLELESAAIYDEAEAAISSEVSSRALSRAESVEERIDLIRGKLSSFKVSLADVVAQLHQLER